MKGMTTDIMDESGGFDKTVQKITWHIVPFICILYIINFLDRVNIGYAALTMNGDLGITPWTYGMISGVFFIGYIVFEVPSNRLLKRLGARVWIPRIMITWGIMVMLIAFSQNAFDVGLFRFLLGAAEAGFFPGVMLYLSSWFSHKNMTKPVAYLYFAQIITIIFGGPVSSWIIDNISWAGIPGWRWLFILEGVPALLLGIVGYWILLDHPNHAAWLSDEEKTQISESFVHENGKEEDIGQVPVSFFLKQWWFHVLWFTYFMLISAHYIILFWLPQIIQNSGISRSHAETGLISSVPYIVSLAGLLFCTWNSHRTGCRVNHMIAAMVLIIAGFTGNSLVSDPVIALAFMSLACMGSFISLPLFWAEFCGHMRRMDKATGIAMLSCLGISGGFAGPALVGAFVSEKGVIIKEISFGIMSVLMVISIVLVIYYMKKVGKFIVTM